MNRIIAMGSFSSLLTSAPQTPVLLVFTPATTTQRSDVYQLLEKARSVLSPALQIMHVNELTHPEVVRSFGLTSFPAFVLLQRGQELWRYSGPVDSSELVYQLGSHIEQTSLKTR